MSIAQQLLIDAKNDLDLLKKVVTGDGTWVYGQDVETKAQSAQWKRGEEPRSKKHAIIDQI